MKKLMILNMVLLLFLTGCMTERIDGVDLERDYVRSNHYTVEYGVETHFEMGTLMPLITYNVCGVESYLSDDYGMYEISGDTVVTYLELNGNQFKVELDNPKVALYPMYDLDLYEELIWDREFTKGIFSRRYSTSDEDYRIYFNDISHENFSYMIIKMDEDDIFQYTSRNANETCFEDQEAMPLYGIEELVEELIMYAEDWHNEDVRVFDVVVDEVTNDVLIITNMARITISFERGEIFYDLEGVNDLYYDIDEDIYSYYDFNLNEMRDNKYVPSHIDDVYDEAQGYLFELVLRTYDSIFRTIRYEQ